MKKILLCVPLLAIFAAGFFGCSQQRQWNHEQRKAMREALRSYRQMVYLDDLNDAEFVLFSDEVAGQLENSYPVYMDDRRRTERRRPQHAAHLPLQLPRSAGRAARRA